MLSQRRLHPISYSASGTEVPRIRLFAEHDKLFNRLRGHPGGGHLWEEYEILESDLVEHVIEVFRAREGYSFRGAGREKSCLFIDVPMEYRDAFGRGGSIVFYDLKSSFDEVVKEVDAALLKGIVGGHCDYCPDA